MNLKVDVPFQVHFTFACDNLVVHVRALLVRFSSDPLDASPGYWLN